MPVMSESIAKLNDSVADAAVRCRRQPEEILTVLISKTVPVERIQEAYNAGVRDFGENRIQEWLPKMEALPPDIRWHIVGHLQTNKIRYLFDRPLQHSGRVPFIHSVDRPEIAQELVRMAIKKNVSRVPCLIQVNSSHEATKGGFEPDEVASFLRSWKETVLEFQGLMTIGPLTEDTEAVRGAFKTVRGLLEQLKRDFPAWPWKILSMGMSGDYKIAIEEGANVLRIGSLVFGSRPAAGDK